MAKPAISKTSQKVALRERTVPIPSSVEKVKGHKTLTIYKMEASPYYYVRLYEDKKILRRSTKTEDRREAIRFAEEFFVEIKTKKLNKLPLTTKSGFEVCAWGLLKENEAKVKRKELAARKIDHDRRRLEADLLPFFKKYEVADIDYSAITAYIAKLNDDPDERFLSTNSLKVHLSHIKTILKYAQRHGVIKTLPAFPTLKTVDEPRGWFNSADYAKLHNTARTHMGERFEIKTKDGNVVRTGVLTQEIYELILFMVNTFIRPTDIRVLKHKHVEVVLNKQDAFLRLTHPATKKHASPMVSMPKAIEVYKAILKRQKKEKLGRPEDFVFQPEHPDNRDYAIQQLHRQFDHLLKITGLKQDPAGRPRTLYSLRHTAIMFRLTESQGLDLLSLARAARTSVEMIDRFYAKHLTAEMNVAKIQSQRSETKQKRTKALKNRLLSEEESDE